MTMAHPIALQLRNLQSLVEIGVDKNTTVVFPATLMSTIQELGAFLTRETRTVDDRLPPGPADPMPSNLGTAPTDPCPATGRHERGGWIWRSPFHAWGRPRSSSTDDVEVTAGRRTGSTGGSTSAGDRNACGSGQGAGAALNHGSSGHMSRCPRRAQRAPVVFHLYCSMSVLSEVMPAWVAQRWTHSLKNASRSSDFSLTMWSI